MKRITFYLVGFAFLMFFDTLGQCSFKMTAIHALPLTFDLPWLGRVFWQPYVYMAIGGYIGAFFTWMTLLKRAPVGPAFACIASGSGYGHDRIRLGIQRRNHDTGPDRCSPYHRWYYLSGIC